MITVRDKYLYTEKMKLSEQLEQDSNNNYKIDMLICPINKTSRNGVQYDAKSLEQLIPKIKGKKILYNHETEGEVYPRGEFVSAEMTNEGLVGHGIIYNVNYNKSLIEFLNASETATCSLQVVGDAESRREELTGKQYSYATINDLLEVSIVPVPGFEDAKITSFEYYLAENLKLNQESITLNNSKEDINTSTASGALTTAILSKKEKEEEGIILEPEKEIKKEEMTPDNNNVIAEVQEVPEDKKEIEESIKKEEYDSTMEDVTSILEDIKNRLTALEQKSIAKESVEEPKEEDDEKLKESEEDKKTEDEPKDKIIKEAEDTAEDKVEDKKEEDDKKPKPPLLENMKIKFSPIDLNLKESIDMKKAEFTKATKELFFKK
jgi:phage head maturation protease